jgi:hypothetical protein
VETDRSGENISGKIHPPGGPALNTLIVFKPPVGQDELEQPVPTAP